MNKKQIFIAVVIILGIFGLVCATSGLIQTAIDAALTNPKLGIVLGVFDLTIVAFCVWAIIYGIVEPLRKLQKK